MRNRITRKITVIAIVFGFTLLGGWNASFYLRAQTITVRLLNAKTGKPMKGKKVTFEWDGKLDHTVITIDNSHSWRVQKLVKIRTGSLTLIAT
jgi:cbb3-type cytochrome oxidase subunit 1